jgi:hypothetical protein
MIHGIGNYSSAPVDYLNIGHVGVRNIEKINESTESIID